MEMLPIGLVLKIGRYVVFTYIIWRIFIYVLTNRRPLLIGFLIALVGIAIQSIIFTPKHPQQKRKKQIRFKFTYPAEWRSELKQLQTDQAQLNLPIVSESFLLSETIDDLIDLIINEFIQKWYSQITSSSLVTDSIKIEIKHVIRNLKYRLEKIDFAKVLVTNILPIVQDHFQSYIQAEELVESKTYFLKNDSSEFHTSVANAYKRGKLHPAVTVSNNIQANINERKYLRGKVSSFLPYVLSEHEKHNEIGVTLTTEILACTVLCNVVNVITESDFYNLMIVKLIGDNLRRRNQVMKLRAALEEHTQGEMKRRQVLRRQLELPAAEDFQGILDSIDKSENLESLLLLEDAILQIDDPISRIQLKKRLDQKRDLLFVNDSSMKLSEILNNPTSLNVFKTCMIDNGRSKMLEFWLAVEGLKAPLEQNDVDDDDMNALSLEYTNADDIKRIIDAYIVPGYIPVDDSTKAALLSLSDLRAGGSTVHEHKKVRGLLIQLQGHVYDEIEAKDFELFKNSNVYMKQLQTRMGEQLHVNPEIVHAVESAFSEIMNTSDVDSLPTKQVGMSISKSTSLADVFRWKNKDSQEIFGLDDGSSANRSSRLFDSDDSEEEDEEEGDDEVTSDSSSFRGSDLMRLGEDLEVQLAGPGNLNLAEEIRKLTDEVENLHEQLAVLEPLIKKAELSNNVSQLKVLRKSKVALVREINFKELQKQQYIVQENDNSLYGKSRVCIQSYISGNENGKEFILYIIEVQKFSNEDPNITTAGWVVARRFSQFYRLHQHLKWKYPAVANLKFPKRSVLVLKFQQRQIVELRRHALEEYLQQLIAIPEVCSNKAFRSFLSSENFNLRKNQRFGDAIKQTKENAEILATKWYNGLSSMFLATGAPMDRSSGAINIDTMNNLQMVENIRDMERELKQFDESSTSKTTMFVKPICDLLITVFKLHSSKSWLRGRALVVILQQLFGTTIEKKVYEQVENQLKTEESLHNLFTMLTNLLFPNGKFKDPPPLRTLYQQSSTRQEAKALFEMFMDEICSKIFGSSNTKFASSRLFRMIQNDFLNRHLVFEILDELLGEIFPEIR